MVLMPEKNVKFKVVGILNRPDEITTIGIKVKKGSDSSSLGARLYKLPDVQIVGLQQVKDRIMKLISTARRS